jgi:hypothetical protein
VQVSRIAATQLKLKISLRQTHLKKKKTVRKKIRKNPIQLISYQMKKKIKNLRKE